MQFSSFGGSFCVSFWNKMPWFMNMHESHFSSDSTGTQTPPVPVPPPPVVPRCRMCRPCPAGQRVDPTAVDANRCSTCSCRYIDIFGRICPTLQCPQCSTGTTASGFRPRNLLGCPICGSCSPAPFAVRPIPGKIPEKQQIQISPKTNMKRDFLSHLVH